MNAVEAFQETAEQFARQLAGLKEDEVHAVWLEVVKAQEAIDSAAMRHAPNAEGWSNR